MLAIALVFLTMPAIVRATALAIVHVFVTVLVIAPVIALVSLEDLGRLNYLCK